MNDPVYDELIEISLRRALTPDEEARLQALLVTQPELQAGWEEDAALHRQLRHLPDIPVSSNFTALVMQAVDAEVGGRRSAVSIHEWFAWVRRHVPQAATAFLVLFLGVLSLHQYQAFTRHQMARGVTEFPIAAAFPAPEVFQDFDAIQQLRPLPAVSDDDLLAALQ